MTHYGSLFFFYLIKINSALMQTFSLPCFSSSNRVGGVAHDCMDSALKSSFPWLQAPFCLWSVRISECDTKADCKEGGGVSTTTPALLARVHLFNSGLLYRGGTFFILFRLYYFPRFPIISPGELIRTLASENKNPTILNMIGFRFILMHGY